LLASATFVAEVLVVGFFFPLFCYLLVVFLFFSFFFCNHAFIVFRYKKPHAALAMERTKPINQKNINKRKSRHQVSIHYRAGFSSAGPTATCNKESTTHS